MMRKIIVVSAALVALTCGAASAAAPLRVCADPGYMPYSNRAGQGFENKIAQIVAHALGRPVQYVWQSIRGDGFDEMVHNQLDAGKCDLIVDVPYAMTTVKTTKPYYISSYVFIVKRSSDDITSLDSPALRQAKIGYESDTPAEGGLKLRALTIGAKHFDTADNDNGSPADILNAVEKGQINVGLTWSPAVGYFLAKYPDLKAVVIPNSRAQGTPEQYSFPMAMATRSGNDAFANQLNQVIRTHEDDLLKVLRAYHISFFEPGGPS